MKPTASEDSAVTGGWTHFFKRSVVDRLRRNRMSEGEEGELEAPTELSNSTSDAPGRVDSDS